MGLLKVLTLCHRVGHGGLNIIVLVTGLLHAWDSWFWLQNIIKIVPSWVLPILWSFYAFMANNIEVVPAWESSEKTLKDHLYMPWQ